jgi:hypothetical protein
VEGFAGRHARGERNVVRVHRRDRRIADEVIAAVGLLRTAKRTGTRRARSRATVNRSAGRPRLSSSSISLIGADLRPRRTCPWSRVSSMRLPRRVSGSTVRRMCVSNIGLSACASFLSLNSPSSAVRRTARRSGVSLLIGASHSWR